MTHLWNSLPLLAALKLSFLYCQADEKDIKKEEEEVALIYDKLHSSKKCFFKM